MKRIYLFCGVGCVIALFAVTAFSQSSKPCCETPCCEKQAVAGKTADCAVKTTTCCRNAPEVKQETSCAGACCCAVTVKATATVTSSKQANVYDLLEKLEALQVKKDALDSELRETRALLNEKFRTLQERVGKVGAAGFTPVVTEAPITGHRHYEPVTGYRVTLEKNPQTGETKRVVTPVTNYLLRESVPTVTTYGVPLTAPSVYVPAQPAPAPCVPGTVVPTQPVSSSVPPVQDLACPGPVTTEAIPEPRSVKSTKTDRPTKTDVPKVKTPEPTSIPSPK